ncbi:hypothetical protein BgiBS90_026359 [Biomphalaria glabrata]|nr:hypothetical protein BgiBS90_026359 [Biomphalaria glabrata]
MSSNHHKIVLTPVGPMKETIIRQAEVMETIAGPANPCFHQSDCQTSLPDFTDRLRCQTSLPDFTARLHCQTSLTDLLPDSLPDYTARLHFQTLLPDFTARLHCLR